MDNKENNIGIVLFGKRNRYDYFDTLGFLNDLPQEEIRRHIDPLNLHIVRPKKGRPFVCFYHMMYGKERYQVLAYYQYAEDENGTEYAGRPSYLAYAIFTKGSIGLSEQSINRLHSTIQRSFKNFYISDKIRRLKSDIYLQDDVINGLTIINKSNSGKPFQVGSVQGKSLSFIHTKRILNKSIGAFYIQCIIPRSNAFKSNHIYLSENSFEEMDFRTSVPIKKAELTKPKETPRRLARSNTGHVSSISSDKNETHITTRHEENLNSEHEITEEDRRFIHTIPLINDQSDSPRRLRISNKDREHDRHDSSKQSDHEESFEQLPSRFPMFIQNLQVKKSDIFLGILSLAFLYLMFRLFTTPISHPQPPPNITKRNPPPKTKKSNDNPATAPKELITTSLDELYDSYTKICDATMSDIELDTEDKTSKIKDDSYEAINAYLILGESLLQKSFSSKDLWNEQKNKMTDFWSGVKTRLKNTGNLPLNQSIENEVKELHKKRDWLIDKANILDDNTIKMKAYPYFKKDTYLEKSNLFFKQPFKSSPYALSTPQKEYIQKKENDFKVVHDEFQNWTLNDKQIWLSWLYNSKQNLPVPEIDLQNPYTSDFLNFLRIDILCIANKSDQRKSYLNNQKFREKLKKKSNSTDPGIDKNYLNPLKAFINCYQEKDTDREIENCFEDLKITAGLMSYYSISKNGYKEIVYDDFVQGHSKP